MLESEDYFEQVRQYHQALTWGTLDGTIVNIIYPSRRRLSLTGTQIWRLAAMRRLYRGDNIDCLDQEQTEFGADGRPVPITTYDDPLCTGGTCQQEGFVWVNPYWAPETEVKVCAFDAQQVAQSSNGTVCQSNTANIECGCGPELTWCGPGQTEANILVRESLAQEPSRIFEWVVREGRSYLEAFVTDTTFMNGPVAHYYRHATDASNLVQGGVTAYDVQTDNVPALPYEDVDTWVPVERRGVHSGAFTTLGYLVRFASNRSRANRFATAFYCEPFVPSEEGLPPEEEAPSPNLRERAGCNDCHERLEPMAAHWARWRTGGTHGFFTPEDLSFEQPREECICGEGLEVDCSVFCSTYYVTADNSSDEEFGLYQGLPQAGSWLTEDDRDNAEEGPIALIDTKDEQARIARCAVRNLSEHLLGREMAADDLTWLEDHAQAFEQSGHDYTALVRRLVQDERYRTIR